MFRFFRLSRRKPPHTSTPTPTPIPTPIPTPTPVSPYPPKVKLTKLTPPSPSPVGYLQSFTDSTFGFKVTRVSDQTAMGLSNNRISHEYAKKQPWNSDGTMILLDWNYPATIINGSNYGSPRQKNNPSASAWSNTEPFYAYGGASGTNQFVKVDMRSSGQSTTLRSFTQYDSIDFGKGEGNLSNDDRYVALFGYKSGNTDIFVYDIKNNIITATRSLGAIDGAILNNISMSQSGNYVVIQYQASGSADRQGFWVLDPANNLVNLRNVSPRLGSHYDLGYDTAGNEVIVIQDDSSRALIMRRLDNGAKTVLLGEDKMSWPIHISTRCLNRPGWAYISSFSASYAEPDKPNYQLVFAVELDPNAAGDSWVNMFAWQQHSINNEVYERMPMTTCNRDGSKVMWASDWGDSGAPIYCYIAEKA